VQLLVNEQYIRYVIFALKLSDYKTTWSVLPKICG